MAVAKLPAGAQRPQPRSRQPPSSIPHWIGGRAVAGTGARLPVFDPATGAIAREVALATAADVEAAVASAKAALPAWSQTPPVRRARVLAAFLALLNEHRDALARAHHPASTARCSATRRARSRAASRSSSSPAASRSC